MENTEISMVEARRSFLKKVAYTAPAVIALGALTLPASAQASVFTSSYVNPQTGDTNVVSVDADTKYSVINGGTVTTGDNTFYYTADQVKTDPTKSTTFKWFFSLFPQFS